MYIVCYEFVSSTSIPLALKALKGAASEIFFFDTANVIPKLFSVFALFVHFHHKN